MLASTELELIRQLNFQCRAWPSIAAAMIRSALTAYALALEVRIRKNHKRTSGHG